MVELTEKGIIEYHKQLPLEKKYQKFCSSLDRMKEEIEKTACQFQEFFCNINQQIAAIEPLALEKSLQTMENDCKKLIQDFQNASHIGLEMLSIRSIVEKARSSFVESAQKQEQQYKECIEKLKLQQEEQQTHIDSQRKEISRLREIVEKSFSSPSQATSTLEKTDIAMVRKEEAPVQKSPEQPSLPKTATEQIPSALPDKKNLVFAEKPKESRLNSEQPKFQEKDKAEISEEKIAHELEKAYRRIVDQNPLLICPELPEVYREALPHLPGLSVSQYLMSLNKLCGQEKIDLHHINDPHAARESEFAIYTHSGVIYYVSWRK